VFLLASPFALIDTMLPLAFLGSNLCVTAVGPLHIVVTLTSRSSFAAHWLHATRTHRIQQAVANGQAEPHLFMVNPKLFCIVKMHKI
jgi:hypothetical protein